MSESESEMRLRAFRATDTFALEAFHTVRALGRTEGDIVHHDGFLPAWLSQGLALLLVAAIVLPWGYRTWRGRTLSAALHKADTSQPKTPLRRH